MENQVEIELGGKDVIERGDVFYADFSTVLGAREGILRPVLIVQTDLGMRNSPTVIAAEITSKMPQTLLSTQVNIATSENDLSNDSVILLGEIRTLDKGRLKEKIGHLDKQTMQDVGATISETLNSVEKNEMTTSKKLMDIIGMDEHQMCIDLGRQIINCPICGNETFNDWFICPYCNWQAEILHFEDEYSPANKSTIEEYRKKYLSEN
jgi:mRNA interferase MazF